MDTLTTPKGRNPLEHRDELWAIHGALVYDLTLCDWRCQACSAAVTSDSLVFPFVRYRRLADARAACLTHANELATRELSLGEVKGTELAVTLARPHGVPWQCGACGGQPRLVHTDTYVFNSALGHDLVIRAHPGATTLLLHRTARGLEPLGDAEGLEKAFLRDALVRALAAAHDHSNVDEGAEIVSEAIEHIPGDPELFAHLAWLNNHGFDEVVLAVAEAAVRVAPEYAEGHFWRAQILVQHTNAGRSPPSALDDATSLLQEALRLRPDYPDAQVALANVARVQRRDGVAEQTLRALLALHPEHDVGAYTLGLLLVARCPAEALPLFAQGETRHPRDPDYPRSRARALWALGRRDEARAALTRARKLAPHDPRIAEAEPCEIYTRVHRLCVKENFMIDYTHRLSNAPAREHARSSALSTFMNSVYRWMSLGLLVTALTSYVVASSPLALNFILGNRIIFYGLLVAELGVVLMFTRIATRASTATTALAFLGYSALNGLTFSVIFVVYTSSSIAQTFFITAGAFAALSIYGSTTKRDLSAMGRFMFVGLIGLIIASVVNLFFHNPAIYWVSTYAGVLIFSGLTAFETQRLRNVFQQAGSGGNLALQGALMFYLDFINLFLMLLRIFGSRR